jgi:DNA-binding transcriptional regulator YiaG
VGSRFKRRLLRFWRNAGAVPRNIPEGRASLQRRLPWHTTLISQRTPQNWPAAAFA